MEKLKYILSAVIITLFVQNTVSAEFITIEPESARFDTVEVLAMAEVMPEIKGGIKEVYKHIEYPREARRNNVEGRVFVKFIVDESGNVKNPQVLKDIGAGCGEAAIEGIKKVKFSPGTNSGKPVSVYYTLPITFKIQN